MADVCLILGLRRPCGSFLGYFVKSAKKLADSQIKVETACVAVNCLCKCAVELKWFVLIEVYKEVAPLASAAVDV